MRISDWSSDVCSSDLGRGAVGIAANRENPLPASPCLRRGRGQIKSSRLRPLLHAAALALDRAPADVVAVELAGPGDAGHFGVSALLRSGNAVPQHPQSVL